MRSAIFEGTVNHVRTSPVRHSFFRRITFLSLDLDEWDAAFRGKWLWGHRTRNLYSIRRKDHLGDPKQPLKESVADWVESTGRARPEGPISLLTLPATFGFVMNPVSMYFCFTRDEQLQWVVAEVNNTPWGERQCYLLDPRAETLAGNTIGKSMHVSPFLPMDLQYRWSLRWSGEQLGIAFHCQRESQTLLTVSLDLAKQPWSARNLRRYVWRHPLGGLGVWMDIYWQAVKLKLKGAPFFPHPRARAMPGITDARVAPAPISEARISEVKAGR